MNTDDVAKLLDEPGVSIVKRPIGHMPIFRPSGRDGLAVDLGTVLDVGGRTVTFDAITPIHVAASLDAGADYAVLVAADDTLVIERWVGKPDLPLVGGFHYAPGGNATARTGGDAVPAINPCSIWDVGFRPDCRDPRGMAVVAGVPGSEGVKAFWVDIYLLNVNHYTVGTSVFGAPIADGYDHKPSARGAGRVAKLDYATAVEIMAGHGKRLLSINEFFAAAYGVTEKTAAGRKPEYAGLDAPRTSLVGMMQATGNLYVWGRDGDPDTRRASFFGGFWGDGVWAGSRQAGVGDWPDYSLEWIGARGRSDHLQPDA